jgi:anaerobic magnesium-protoporphyrin IX monomethyl ester cyclase
MERTLLLVEPPKKLWFVMGDYLPPPMQLLQLGAYVEREMPEVRLEIVDCQAEGLDHQGLKDRVARVAPDVVALSGNMTCNAYTVARSAEIAKEVDPAIRTVVGGQHYSFLADRSLRSIPEIDFIVRHEGELTFVELLRSLFDGQDPTGIQGLSFRHDGEVIHTPERAFLPDLDTLPYPAYHLVEHLLDRYHFRMMTGPHVRYFVVEGSRGCQYDCAFCTQCLHWKHTWRTKSAKRLADEFQFLQERYGGGESFFWLADDNFMLAHRGPGFCDAMDRPVLRRDAMWFVQARADDIAKMEPVVPRLRQVGCAWILLGVEHNSDAILGDLNKRSTAAVAKKAIGILNRSDILSQAMFILGSRQESEASAEALREFVIDLDPGIPIFGCLTPFPGTRTYQEAETRGWIEDRNWSHYDMIHAIMPTENLSRRGVQEELYACYRRFFGSIPRGIRGLVSKNRLKRGAYRRFMTKRIIRDVGRL